MDASAETTIYEIRIGGYIDSRRASQLADMALTRLPDGETLLVGPVADQAALFGLLSRIRDLGIVLISLQRRDLDRGSASTT